MKSVLRLQCHKRHAATNWLLFHYKFRDITELEKHSYSPSATNKGNIVSTSVWFIMYGTIYILYYIYLNQHRLYYILKCFTLYKWIWYACYAVKTQHYYISLLIRHRRGNLYKYTYWIRAICKLVSNILSSSFNSRMAATRINIFWLFYLVLFLHTQR